MILDTINNVNDIKKLNINEKKLLASEIRDLLIKTTSNNGGHLASNLGIVELTIAILSVFDMPKDKIIFDVGHQCYTYKILTDRKDKFNTIRKYNGISGFPKTNESIFDSFNTGHSSTSISVSSGIKRALNLKNKDNRVICVIGDGALTGGLALEALNDVGSSNLNITVILNDNEMSISKNVGGIALLLSHLRTKKIYVSVNTKIKFFFKKIPIIGRPLIKVTQKTKQILKRIFIKNMFFEDIGFTYLGPIDGHDIKVVEDILKRSKKISGPVLIHVLTKKGKGYKYSEENPSKFHGISPFNIETGELKKKKTIDYSNYLGNKLVSLASKNKKIVAITAAMSDGTGLKEFKEKYKDRFFDVGIAEEHALCLASGLSKEGFIPFVPIYSSFLQRGYDQLVHDVCLNNCHVILCVDRAGLVGEDGETHHGILDLSYLSTIPNMTIMAPKDFNEFNDMINFAIKYDGPIAIRYPRGSEEYSFNTKEPIKLGKSEILKVGKDLTIIAIGKEVYKAKLLSDMLEKDNISCEIINVRFLKPIDKNIIKSISKTKATITIEDNIMHGGLYSSILQIINENNLKVTIKGFGYDSFVTQGTTLELEKKYHMDLDSIYKETLRYLKSNK